MKSYLCVMLFICVCGILAKKGSPADFLATLHLEDEHLTDIFVGLDPKITYKIDQRDLRRLYYYGHSGFAQKKFIEFINKEVANDICKSEVDAFVKKQPVTNSIWECTYIKSKSRRQYCFADQVITYVYLLLHADAIKQFFRSLDGSNDESIQLDEVKNLVALNERFTDNAALNFMKEIGGDDQIIIYEEFVDYVSQEELLYNFRVCRRKIVDYVEVYDNDCLKGKLVNWTMNHLTELDRISIFGMFEDDDDEDFDITENDLKKVDGCSEDVAKKFVKLMDTTKDGKVCYGEFRTYVMSHMVRLHLERDCASKYQNQVQEVECYKEKLIKRVEEFHTPIWMSIPDLDMVFSFEELDHTNDGKIDVEEDLVKGHGWKKEVAEKMVREIDGLDGDTLIDLEEFNEFVGWPNIVYGIGDCLGFRRHKERIRCYSDELMKNVDVMLETNRVEEFFKFYDKDNSGHITQKEVDDAAVKGEDTRMFLDEMGMGDDTITYDEFKWYVRQEELGSWFKDCKTLPDLHGKLLSYMKRTLTEYNTQRLFRDFDTNGAEEVEGSDFGANYLVIYGLLQRMDDLDDKDATVNFVEFWIYLQTPKRNPRKENIENECESNEKEQQNKFECFKKQLLPKNI